MNQSILLKIFAVCTIVSVLLAEITVATGAGPPDYYFRRYSFRKKQKNERKIKVLKQQCETSEQCRGLYGLDQTRCARNCMSPECYSELYGHDELEEGEIDVRFNSFKGCVIEKVPN